jgi:hypothetical protein
MRIALLCFSLSFAFASVNPSDADAFRRLRRKKSTPAKKEQKRTSPKRRNFKRARAIVDNQLGRLRSIRLPSLKTVGHFSKRMAIEGPKRTPGALLMLTGAGLILVGSPSDPLAIKLGQAAFAGGVGQISTAHQNLPLNFQTSWTSAALGFFSGLAFQNQDPTAASLSVAPPA